MNRYEGGYQWYPEWAGDKLAKRNAYCDLGDMRLDEAEAITRMMKVLNEFRIYDLKTIDWEQSFEDQGIDSLESTAILTSIEHEFHTVFEDHVFE